MKINITIQEDAILEGALKVLKKVRPQWPASDVTFKMLTDGITNKLVQCSLPKLPEEEIVLIRIYGNNSELLIDRQSEISNIQMLSKVNLAPELYATFKNGIVYQFVPGCTLCPLSVRQPEIYRLVARHMARLHKVQPDPAQKYLQSTLWTKMDQFRELVPEYYLDDVKQKKYLNLPFQKVHLMYLIEKTKLYLLQYSEFSPVVFCHNDLLLGNVIYTKEKNSVTFIDFEYSSPNYQAFDIANHFAEFAGVENVNYDNFPNETFQLKWLQEYLDEFGATYNKETDLRVLYEQVSKFVMVTHLFWGMWALIQAQHSHIDFDFIGYANTRFDQYLRTAHKSILSNCEL